MRTALLGFWGLVCGLLIVPYTFGHELLGRNGDTFRVALKAFNGLYVVADQDRPLKAQAEVPNLWEQFDLIHVGDGWYVLQSHYNKQFVRFADNELRADRQGVTDDCRFRIHIGEGQAEKRIIAISTATGRFVTTEGRDARLTANREKPEQWETFQLDFPTEYEPFRPLPPNVQKKWVEADGEFHAVEAAVGVPGIAFDCYFLGPAGAQVKGHYFLIGNDDEPTTLDGATLTKVHCSGLYAEAQVRVPFATWVLYSATGGRFVENVPLPRVNF